MNTLIQTLKTIVGIPALLYLVMSIIGFIGITVFAGIKIGCLVLGIWAFVVMFGYAIYRANDY